MIVLQFEFVHWLLCLKWINAHQGWYKCLQIDTTMSLCGNPHKQIAQGEILMKLGPFASCTS